MIYVNFNHGNKLYGGVLLATYTKKLSANHIEKPIEIQQSVENIVEQGERKIFLVFLPLKNKKKIMEIEQKDVICTTLNFVPEMINLDYFEAYSFENFQSEDCYNTNTLQITDFYGYPFVVENKDFLIKQINSDNSNLETLYQSLPECATMEFEED